MTRVKVCGITNREDAEWCARCGADALGFNFADSPRRVTPERAREILRGLDPFVTGVGVFVDQAPDQVRSVLDQSGCSIAQLHGEESAEYVQSLAPYGVIKVMRVRDRLDESGVSRYKGARAILLDTYVPGMAGGTGQRFDLKLATALVQGGWRVIVAGGLTPENVGEAVAAAHPYGVDVSSGVECRPGRKDHEKVAQFIAAVRAADEAVSRGGCDVV